MAGPFVSELQPRNCQIYRSCTHADIQQDIDFHNAPSPVAQALHQKNTPSPDSTLRVMPQTYLDPSSMQHNSLLALVRGLSHDFE